MNILRNAITRRIILGQVRHLLNAGGAALATNGYVTGSEAETLVGAATIVISMALSALSGEKRQ